MSKKTSQKTRLKILLIILSILVVIFGIVFYYYGPYSEAARLGRPKKSARPRITARLSPSVSPQPSPSPAISPTILFSDDFSGTLSQWDIVYTGYGTIRIDNGELFMAPKTPTSPSETHASLIAVNKNYWQNSWNDYKLSCKMKTSKQLRTGSSPNPWEVGWLFFRYVDAQHFYYFIHKTNGIELGKFSAGSQTFFITKDSPKLSLETWNNYRIETQGSNIKVYINDLKVADYTDNSNPYLTGKIGLYDEDAAVYYDDVMMTSN